MALAAFQRLADRLLARLGEQAILRGAVRTRANVENGVESIGSDGMVVVLANVVTLPSATNPAPRDTITVAGVNYRLDAVVSQAGGLIRFSATVVR